MLKTISNVVVTLSISVEAVAIAVIAYTLI